MKPTKDKMAKIIKLKMTGYCPCPWDDLIDENKKYMQAFAH